MQFSPIFRSLIAKIRSMPKSEWDTKSGCRLFALAMKHAPAEFNDQFIKGAMEEGLFPKPTRCDENGEPLYCLEEVSDFFGMSREEGRKAYNEMLEAEPDICEGLHQGAVYVIQ
jgi:hypothetical protein